MSRVVIQKMLNDNKKNTFSLQLTSLVDMFTLLLVFLLLTQGTSTLSLPSDSKISLPKSISTTDPNEMLKITITKEAIFVEDKKVVDLLNQNIAAKDIDITDSQLLPSLYEALKKKSELSRDIASKNEDVEVPTKVILMADRDLPYGLLKKVMYSALLAGYVDLKLATILME